MGRELITRLDRRLARHHVEHLADVGEASGEALHVTHTEDRRELVEGTDIRKATVGECRGDGSWGWVS